MLVSVVVSAFNEEKYLPGLIDDFKKQTYPHSLIEIILINAMSTDSSKKIMETFRDNDEEFYSVKVLDNVKKTQPSGFNFRSKKNAWRCYFKSRRTFKNFRKFYRKKCRGDSVRGRYFWRTKTYYSRKTTDDFSKTLSQLKKICSEVVELNIGNLKVLNMLTRFSTECIKEMFLKK